MSRDLERALEPAIDEERIAANWQRIAERRAGPPRVAGPAPRSRRRVGRWAFALAAAATAAALALYVGWPARGGPLTAVDIAIAPGSVLDAPAHRVVALDDGSALDLAGGAQLQVLTNEADRFVMLLVRGRARFDVQPGGARRWEIETSRATVEVVGTAFTVESDEHRVVVEVEHGVVMVRGERVPGRVARLVAGDRLAIEDPAGKLADASPAKTPPPADSLNAPTPARAATSTAHAPAPPRPDARRGSDDPAHVAAVPPAGHATADSRKLAATLGEVDQRRASGDAEGAAALLEQALATTHDDPSLGLAEFTLGRLYLEELGAPDRAAAAFAKMIALGSPHALLEDAYARRIEALARARRTDEARAALADYDRLYPHGLRRTALHALLP